MSDQGKPAKRPLRLSVDWGQKWPLNDYIGPGPIVDWDSKITPELKKRLREWAMFFQENADLDTSLFGSEKKRRWFQREGFRLLKELQEQAGDEFDFTIDLWF